jgi:hypothetical protein
MKHCTRVSELFLVMHDNQADRETEESFREHMSTCPHCREDFRWYGMTVQALGDLERVSPPEAFMRELRARLYTPDSPGYVQFFRKIFSSGPYLPVPVGVAAVACIVVFSFLLYNHSVTEISSEVGPHQNAQEVAPPSSGPTKIARTQTNQFGAGTIPAQGILAQTTKTPFSTPATNLPRLSMATPNTIPVNRQTVSTIFPTLADRIGADNLTVESLSVERAVESLKQLLPDLQGRLVEVKPHDGVGEIVLGVTIPSEAYGDLTGKLINYGAVESGAGAGVTPPKLSKDGKKTVFLYIRFVNPR